MDHALESLGKREIRELISKGWITHDAMWFVHCLKSLGIEKTNALNRAAIRSMSAVEVLRLKHILGVETDTFESFDELAKFLKQAFEIVLADFMRAKFSLTQRNALHWELEKGNCFAYKGMCRLDVADKYECGVLYRIESWLDSLNVSYSMHPPVRSCLMHLNGECAGSFHFNF